MENQMEATTEGSGFRDVTPISENQMDMNMETEMATGTI